VAIGGATGAVGSILGVEERPRFREYVIREHHPSFGTTTRWVLARYCRSEA